MIEAAEVRAGEAIPELRRVVEREDMRVYAEVSGDDNPLHLDDDFARSVGQDGVIAHGMFTMGHMATCALAWAGDGARIVKLSAQFRASVLLGDEIVAGGSVRSVDPDAGTVTLQMWVAITREDEPEWAIKRGEVVLTLG
jgi:acyl dehydratase